MDGDAVRTAILKRTETGDAGTFGFLMADVGRSWVTGELPQREGIPGVSAIPPGAYLVEWAQSPRFGWCYHVRNVPGRSSILIHVGNFVGDTERGFKCDVLGCIVPGLELGELQGQRAVIHSKAACLAIEREFIRKPWELTIADATASAADHVCEAFKKTG